MLTNDQLQKVSSLLLNEFNEGLSRETHHIAAVKMLPTFVRDVPNGSERGKFLALDLGGTNFRVLLITLDGDQIDKTKIENTIFTIPQEIMLGSGEQVSLGIHTDVLQSQSNDIRETCFSDIIMIIKFRLAKRSYDPNWFLLKLCYQIQF